MFDERELRARAAIDKVSFVGEDSEPEPLESVEEGKQVINVAISTCRVRVRVQVGLRVGVGVGLGVGLVTTGTTSRVARLVPDVHPGARSPPFEGEHIELN